MTWIVERRSGALPYHVVRKDPEAVGGEIVEAKTYGWHSAQAVAAHMNDQARGRR